jgi:hypothetical protein
MTSHGAGHDGSAYEADDFTPALMGAMLDRLGCEEARAVNRGAAFTSAARRCLGCANAQLCGNWLEIAAQPRAAPAFCPNQTFFASLLRSQRRRSGSH